MIVRLKSQSRTTLDSMKESNELNSSFFSTDSSYQYSSEQSSKELENTEYILLGDETLASVVEF
jgi:hypothetical protein